MVASIGDRLPAFCAQTASSTITVKGFVPSGVALAAGTVFTSGRTLILRPSGSLEEASDDEDIQVDATASGYLLYHPSDGRFHPWGT